MQRRINSFINEYQEKDVEYALVFLSSGEVWFSRGTSKSVLDGFSKDLTGATVIHNHPDGETEWSFSIADYMMFTEKGMNTLYGFDSKYVYRFSREDLSVDDETVIDSDVDYDYQHNMIIQKVLKNQSAYHVGYRRFKY